MSFVLRSTDGGNPWVRNLITEENLDLLTTLHQSIENSDYSDMIREFDQYLKNFTLEV